MSKLEIFPSLLMKVAFAIPPKFKIVIGILIFFCLTNNWWKIGDNGAPCPPFFKSLDLKSKTTFIFVICDKSLPSPSCIEIFSSGLCSSVWPWNPIKWICCPFFYKGCIPSLVTKELFIEESDTRSR